MLYLLIVGLITILGQVVLLRELAVSFFGIELIYIVGIGIWLLGTGIGSVIRTASFQPIPANVSVLLLCFSILLLLDIGFIRGLRNVFGGVSGAYLSFPQQLVGLGLALLPIGLISGLLFQWSAKSYLVDKRTAAAAYAIESAGGVGGGMLSVILSAIGIQNTETALVCSVIACVPTAVQSVYKRRDNLLHITSLLFVFGFIILWVNAERIDLATVRWNHPNVILTRDTPYGRVTIDRYEDQISVYENDILSFESEGVSAEEIVHLALLAHPIPKRILILGGATEGMVSYVLQHKPERIDDVELNERMLRAVLPLLAPEMQQSFIDPRVHFHKGDPRRALTRLERYDVILLGSAEPVSGQTNRFFTREFFQVVAAHLNPEGVFAFRLRSAENFWSEPLTQRNASIISALDQVFVERLFLPGSNPIFLAAKDSLPQIPEVFESRFLERGINARLVSPAYIHYLFVNDRRSQYESKFANVNAVINTDEQPVCYYYAAAVWLSKFYPSLLRAGKTYTRHMNPWHFTIAFSLAVFTAILIVRRQRARIGSLSILVAVAGGCGMILETMLLLRFQSVSGVLYQDIGLLLTLFMLGLSAGAGLMSRIIGKSAKHKSGIHAVGVACMMLLILLSILIVWRIRTGEMEGLGEVGLALFFSGVSVAMVFGYAGAGINQQPGRIIGQLYGADLMGGCVGSLTASLILIPLAGLVWSGVFCAALCFVSMAVFIK